MINIILEEADESIKKSYYEGYKQATIELLPEISSLQNQIESYKKKQFTTYFTTAAISLSAGLIGGTVFGISIKLNN